ncbi:DNA polymerase IV [Pseudonocardia sp. Cha107L01]|uniref:DNA polymerase IV n=1 Tax=Pseudonocardia sp. Cha107L01 TaxID=3457576 RepID=UPI00403ED912
MSRPPSAGRWVLHLDMDAFFASVEQLTRPTLLGRAVLVGGLGPRGVVAGASYESRVHGARSAMPMSRARRLVPAAVVLPPRIAVYRVLSERVFGIVRELDATIEQISVDEAFVEPAGLIDAPAGEVEQAAEELRARIKAATGLTASVGAGSGKQLAKIASTMAKPDGVRVVPHGTERELLAPLPVRKLWGVGPVAETTLHRVGVETIGALAALSVPEVTALLGVAMGTELHGLAQGVDRRPVAERGEAKQVSAETTFDADLSDLASVRRAVAEMAEHAHRRLLASGRAARTVTVKIRGADFATRSRSETTPIASTNLAVLSATAQRLTEGALPDSGVRLIGVSLSGLTGAVQQYLFETGTEAGTGAELATAEGSGAESVAVADGTAVGAEQVEADGLLLGATAVGDGTTSTASAPTPVDGVAGARVAAGSVATLLSQEDPAEQLTPRRWRAGDDVRHTEYGHGWVQGSGHGRVTIRFETRRTGPGQARTMADDDPGLTPADPLASLD